MTTLKEEVEQMKDALYGPDRNNGLTRRVTILWQVYTDVKKVATAVLIAVLTNLALSVFLLLRK